MRSTVSLTKAADYDRDTVYNAVKTLLETLGGIEKFVAPGQRVLLKPNLLGVFKPEMAATTHPAIVYAVAKQIQEAGATVLIGDSPGIGDFKTVLKITGMQAVIDELRLQAVDFTPRAEYHDEQNLIGKSIELAAIFKDVDVVITLPKLKTHAQMTFTGALKNQFGCVPGLDKAKYHYKLKTRDWLAELMVDINLIVKPSLAIMDAITGMEGPGPSGGDPRHIGVLIASADLAAVDIIACSIINLPPETVPVSAAAAHRGYGVADLSHIDIVGEVWQQFEIADYKKVEHLVNILKLMPLPKFLMDWMQRYWSPRPKIIADKCIKCMKCRDVCPTEPPSIDPTKNWNADAKTCIKCYCCHEFCPVKAIDLPPTLLERFSPEKIVPTMTGFYYSLINRFKRS
ncbi:MAG: DUF362 domain-containing protein [Victivallaceae bacterium]|nr:DUF362 domain-containing protein [Victivallaceae bacterium]